ncbi:MAG: histidine kinase dimerization/phospho-acceptor domain-containing protein [Limnobacter sp.]|nr:histidine kinase dimerization/phospho-acceptor domain-containing protein [Limnobacter sp.]
MITLVTRLKSEWAYRIWYSMCTTVMFHAGAICFAVLPQMDDIESVDGTALLYSVPLMFVAMLSVSGFAQSARHGVQMPVAQRMFHVIAVTIVIQSTVSVVLSTVNFKAQTIDSSDHFMHMSHEDYELLLTILCFVLMTLFTIRVYKKVYSRMLGLEGAAEKLARDNLLKEEVVANQRDLLFKSNARVKELEFSLQQEQHSDGICAESLITAVLNLEDGIFEWDLDKNSLKLGPIWSDMLGITTHMDSATRQATLLRGVLPEDWASARLKISNMLTGGSVQEHAQLRYIRPSGAILKMDVRIVAVRNPYGLPNRLVGTLTDRTKDMDVEYAIRKELSEECTLSRLKSDFVSYLSHEIRTPMTIISSANVLLESDLRMNRLNPDNIQDYTDQISNALMSLRALVDETLDFMSTGTSAPLMEAEVRPVNVSALVRAVIELESKRRHLNMDQAIQVELDGSLPELIEVSETPLTHAVRQFVVFVMQELTGATLWVKCDGEHKIRLGVCLPSEPEWLSDFEYKLTPNLPGKDPIPLQIRDEALPFGLLLTKRVIRNINGGLNVLVHLHGDELKYCLAMEFPFARETECQAN